MWVNIVLPRIATTFTIRIIMKQLEKPLVNALPRLYCVTISRKERRESQRRYNAYTIYMYLYIVLYSIGKTVGHMLSLVLSQALLNVGELCVF